MVRYKYLWPGQGKDSDQVLTANISPKDIEDGMFIVQDDTTREFLPFISSSVYWEWEATLEAEKRTFHEVIFGKLPQRLKGDIDVSPNVLRSVPEEVFDRVAPGLAQRLEFQGVNALQARAETFLVYYLNLALDVFVARYPDVVPTPQLSDFIVTNNCGAPLTATGVPEKYSYHVVLAPWLVPNHFEARAFTKALLVEMGEEAPEFVKLVDPNVDKSLQEFRMFGSRKHGSGRPKVEDRGLAGRLGTAQVRSQDMRVFTLIQPREREMTAKLHMLPKTEASDQDNSGGSPIREALTSQDEKIVLQALRNGGFVDPSQHKFLRRIGNLFTFERQEPSHCALCERTHHSENSLLIVVLPRVDRDGSDPSVTVVNLFEKCRRNPGTNRYLTSVACSQGAFPDIAVMTAAPQDANASRKSHLETVCEELADGSRDPYATADKLFDSLPATNKTIYDSDKMRPYENVETLAVKAQVGVGKTNKVRSFLDTHYPTEGVNPLAPSAVIRFVSFRKAFSDSLKKGFPDFKHYSEIASTHITASQAPRAIVQVESLYRLAGDNTPVDLVILDEVESILAQFSSGLHKSFDESFAIFQWFLATATQVICLDANLSDRTFRTLQRMRPHAPVHYHCNTFSRAKNDTVYVTKSRGAWLEKMLTQLQANKKIVIASNSLKEAKTIERQLKEQWPSKRIKLYSSETTQSEKTAHFSDVATYWTNLDVLIYTPTVSAGVSYVLENYDSMFMYLSDQSCDVETARQMMGRVRVLRDKEYFICFRTQGGRYATDLEVLERQVYKTRQIIVDGGVGAFRYDPVSRQVRPYHSPYFHLWLENRRIANLARNNYAERFVDQAAATGATIRFFKIDPEKSDAMADAVNQRDMVAALLDTEENGGVASAPDLTSMEVSNIRQRMEQNNLGAAGDVVDDVSSEERRAVKKFFLRQRYNWMLPIDIEFVRDLLPPEIQNWYKNLQLLLSFGTLDGALDSLRTSERDVHLAIEAGSSDPKLADRLEQLALHNKHCFPTFCYAIWLLRLAGFLCILDPACLPGEWIFNRLFAAKDQILLELDGILNVYDGRHPGYQKVSSTDPAVCGKALLAVVNIALRKTYGFEIKLLSRKGVPRYRMARLPRSKVFSIYYTSPGGTCVFDPPKGFFEEGTRTPSERYIGRPMLQSQLMSCVPVEDTDRYTDYALSRNALWMYYASPRFCAHVPLNVPR